MKAEDPMAMMREAHRELSASYQQVAANKKPSARLCRWFCMKFVRLEVNQMNYSNIHYVNLRAEMARGNIGIGQMAKALHISRDTMARKLAGRSPLHLDEAFRMRDQFFPSCSIEALFREEREERGA
ncbi:hypothetical protein [Hominenteromicrobium sp.]|jgi:DNA-binding XRE family transcriptional regulator|uniref:hypothetical protein n=1 Tax=Hominenteromicrobium sp. TaxID=3073581 RepID=UPI003A910324